MVFRLLADAVVIAHLCFVGFVLFGGLLTLWWPRLALAHVPAIAWAVVIEVTGGICPLTPLEQTLRTRGGAAGYRGGFVEHYLMPVLYPANLTSNLQLWLATAVVVINVAAYAWVWRRRRGPGKS